MVSESFLYTGDTAGEKQVFMFAGENQTETAEWNLPCNDKRTGGYYGGHAFRREGADRYRTAVFISAYGVFSYSVGFRCLFSVLGISNRRKNGLKLVFVSIEFRKNTYFNCAFTPCFAPESDLQN